MKEIKIKTIKELTVQGNASSHAGQCELPTSWEGTGRSAGGAFQQDWLWAGHPGTAPSQPRPENACTENHLNKPGVIENREAQV